MSRNFLKQNHKKKKKTTKIKKRKKEGKDKEGKCRINQVDWLKWAFSDSVYERERERETSPYHEYTHFRKFYPLASHLRNDSEGSLNTKFEERGKDSRRKIKRSHFSYFRHFLTDDSRRELF